MNFGIAIAFFAPGAVLLWALTPYSADLQRWFGLATNSEITVGAFLFVFLGSLALGVFVSGARWALVDKLMTWTGIERPEFRLENLRDPDVLVAYDRVTEMYYRYYQFYANLLVAALMAYGLWLGRMGDPPWRQEATSVGLAVASVLLWLSARDTRRNYFRHLTGILGTSEKKEEK